MDEVKFELVVAMFSAVGWWAWWVTRSLFNQKEAISLIKQSISQNQDILKLIRSQLK